MLFFDDFGIGSMAHEAGFYHGGRYSYHAYVAVATFLMHGLGDGIYGKLSAAIYGMPVVGLSPAVELILTIVPVLRSVTFKYSGGSCQNVFHGF